MQHEQPAPETTAGFLGPYCPWPRKCEQRVCDAFQEIFGKQIDDIKDTLRREFGR